MYYNKQLIEENQLVYTHYLNNGSGGGTFYVTSSSSSGSISFSSSGTSGTSGPQASGGGNLPSQWQIHDVPTHSPYAQNEHQALDTIVNTVASRRGIKPMKAFKTPDNLGTPLASGHFGQVYKVNLPELHKEVIIKVAKANDQDSVVVPTFSSDVREATNMCNVKDPHCVEMFGVDDSHSKQGGAFEFRFITEFVPNVMKFPFAQPVNIKALAKCCAQGMKAIHDQGLIHRDLFARNVFVLSATECKVGDYGLARTVKWDKSKSPDKDLLGLYVKRNNDTVPWGMPPEIVFTAKKNANLSVNKQLPTVESFKCDVWHFGVLLFEWHLNRPDVIAAFHRTHNNCDELLKAYTNVAAWLDHLCVANQRPPISQAAPHLLTLLQTLMHPDPAQRPMFAQIPALIDHAGDLGTSGGGGGGGGHGHSSSSSSSSFPSSSGSSSGPTVDIGYIDNQLNQAMGYGGQLPPQQYQNPPQSGGRQSPGPQTGQGRQSPGPQTGQGRPGPTVPQVPGQGGSAPSAPGPQTGQGRQSPGPQTGQSRASPGPNAPGVSSAPGGPTAQSRQSPGSAPSGPTAQGRQSPGPQTGQSRQSPGPSAPQNPIRRSSNGK